MSNIQFGVMLIFNMCLGNITPPVGSVLFVGCGISKISIEEVTKTLLPYFAVLILILLAVTYLSLIHILENADSGSLCCSKDTAYNTADNDYNQKQAWDCFQGNL